MLEIIGIIGALIILYAFVMNQLSKISIDDFQFDFLNFLGSALLVWYAIEINAIPFMIINGIWGLLSLKDLTLWLFKKRRR